MANNSNGSSQEHAPERELVSGFDAARPSVGVALPLESEDTLAELIGLDEGAAGSDSSSSPYDADLLDDSDLEDEDDDGGKADKTGKTKTPLWANPLVKITFVAGVAGLGFFAVAMVFGALQTAGQRDLTPNVVASDQDAEEAAAVDPVEAALQRQQEEIGQLKTQNALGNQQRALATQSQQQPDPSEVLALRNRQIDLVESLQEERTSQAKEAASTPIPTTAPRPQATAPRPISSPRPPSVASSPPPSRRSTAVSSSVKPVDPQVQWNTLVALGSYGQGSDVAEVSPAPGAEVVIPELSPQADEPLPEGEAQQLTEALDEVLVLTEVLKSEPTYADEEAALLGLTLTTVQSGTFAAARLVTPIYWAQDLANEQQPQRTALELTEPLVADDGSIALAEGTLLVAEVMVIAGSGLLELQVTDVVTVDNGVQRTMQLPYQNIVIAGADGNPLIASEVQDGGGIRAAEMQLAALGALGTLGALLNRPDSSTTIVGGNTGISTVENGSVNVLAGLLQGAADAVLPIEQQRVVDRIDDIDSRPRIWFHEADAEVLVFVTDEFTFRLD